MTNNFAAIPDEMKSYKQWVVWRLEEREGSKPTKVPYSAINGKKASVTNPANWCLFEEACDFVSKYFRDPKEVVLCIGISEKGEPLFETIEVTGVSGIGFVLTRDDPYAFIDLDDTHGDDVAFQRQIKIYKEFDSYSEKSPSGNGLHIIVKGDIAFGRRRSAIEVYSSERYMTMTGDVYADKPIAERNELLNLLYNEMGGDARTFNIHESQEQTMSDEDVVIMASNAANADKFDTLMYGDASSLYAKEDGSLDWSRADMALVDILAFYSQNHEQVIRLWRNSKLGQREKANRPGYAKYMLEKCFDNQLPLVDIDGLRIKLEQMRQAKHDPHPEAKQETKELQTYAAVSPFPPGLLGEVAQFIYDASPRPVHQIALAGAIGLMAGVCGRAFNVSGTGLNQYVLLLAPTGTGKESISSGVDKLMAAISAQVPSAFEFTGPGQIVSAPGLIKWMQKTPCIFSIVGEFGLRMESMAAQNASSVERGLLALMLDLYNKSGSHQSLKSSAYSDKDKNTDIIRAPAFTMIGESVPEKFYEVLDEGMISSGLLPRFLTIHYDGKREYLNKNCFQVSPSFQLVDKFATLVAHCLSIMNSNSVCNIQFTPEAEALADKFEIWTTDKINETSGDNAEVIRHLWNRAGMKSLRLAATVAVGINPFMPTIDANCFQWASNIIVDEVSRMLGKFERGEIGRPINADAAQWKDMLKVIGRITIETPDKWEKYGGNEDMGKDMVIPLSMLTIRLSQYASFRKSRLGATPAIKEMYKRCLEADVIREVPLSQMQKAYGRQCKAFVVSNPKMIKAEETI